MLLKHRRLSEKLFQILSLICILLIFSCSSEKNKEENKNTENSCAQFKTGNFLFHLRDKQGEFFFAINRNDSIQTERDEKTGNYSKLAIKWTDPCTYELKMIETTFPMPDSVQQIRKTKPFKTEILFFTKDYYIFKSQRFNSNYFITDTMWVGK